MELKPICAIIQMSRCLSLEESCKIQKNNHGTKYSPTKIIHMNFFENFESLSDPSVNLFEFSGTVRQLLKDKYITSMIGISFIHRLLKPFEFISEFPVTKVNDAGVHK